MLADGQSTKCRRKIAESYNRTSVTDDRRQTDSRQTDRQTAGRATACSEREREREFTFAKTMRCIQTSGTSWPLSMTALILAASSVSLLTSSRNRSPLDRCVKPYLCTMRSHCVPLPLPGPPAHPRHSVPCRLVYNHSSCPTEPE